MTVLRVRHNPRSILTAAGRMGKLLHVNLLPRSPFEFDLPLAILNYCACVFSSCSDHFHEVAPLDLTTLLLSELLSRLEDLVFLLLDSAAFLGYLCVFSDSLGAHLSSFFDLILSLFRYLSDALPVLSDL